jgi:hypothetical protein
MKVKNIMDIIDASFEDFDMELSEKIKDAPGYNESREVFEETVNALENEAKFILDKTAVRMEVISRDVAINEGFKMAVRLIFSALLD